VPAYFAARGRRPRGSEPSGERQAELARLRGMEVDAIRAAGGGGFVGIGDILRRDDRAGLRMLRVASQFGSS
jgi:hypothetical protein